MNGLQKVGFLALVCFFGSASVFVAGVDLQRRLVKHTSEESEAAKKLIEQLRGENLAPHAEGVVPAQNIPPRKVGSSLSEHDKSKIKKFLGGLVGAEPAQPATAGQQPKPEDQPAEEVPDEASHVPSEVAEHEPIE